MIPARKQNRLADYDYSRPGAYFITVCVKDRKCLLSTVVGGDAYIAPTGGNLSSLVRSWKTLVSKELGYSIWQRSYYDHVIRDEMDYIVKAQYIADNPARWQEDNYYIK